MMDSTTWLGASPDEMSAIAAIAAVVLSVISFLLALWTGIVQRQHNFNSVRPLAYIAQADYEDRVSVKIHNNGVGPLIITQLSVSDGSTDKNNILDWMPELPDEILWDTFVTELKGRSLAPGGQIVLIQLSGDVDDPAFCKARNLCREALRPLSVRLEYVDIYERAMADAHRSLSWFGRHNSNPSISR